MITTKREVLKQDFTAVQNFICTKYEDIVIVIEYKNGKLKVETAFTNRSQWLVIRRRIGADKSTKLSTSFKLR